MNTQRIATFFKGMAMGAIDIVPGVSGSTVAVLLGFYERFVAALKNIDASLIKAMLRPLGHKFDVQSRKDFRDAANHADLPWLVTLLLGLATAFVVASFVIPALMERFPQIMRALFFGLVLGSVITPIREISKWRLRYFVIMAAFATSFFVLLGQQFGAPTYLETVTLQDSQTISSICQQMPCFMTSSDILALPENAALAGIDPQAAIHSGATVSIPLPYYSFTFFSGFCAICAMLLPGISGSFVLLVLGYYYFVLNSGKTFLTALTQGNFLSSHGLHLVCLGLGVLTGIALFSRALAWLLKYAHYATLAAIVGILFGCLRAVWPFQQLNAAGVSEQYFPTLASAQFVETIIAIMCGLGIVVLTLYLQGRKKVKCES